MAVEPTPRSRSMIGPAPPPAGRRVLGPAPPPALDEAARPAAEQLDEEELDVMGPLPASALTTAETAALAELQRARQKAATTREAIASLRASRTSASIHEEWMTQAPTSLSSQAALLAAATGERGMRARGFSTRGEGQGGGRRGEEAGDWTASPQEKEWRRVEREAEREADKAVERAMKAREEAERSRRGGGGGRKGVEGGRREVGAGGGGGEGRGVDEAPSLVELHQRVAQLQSDRGEGRVGGVVGPIFWDREKEMGMRRHKTQTQITAEMRGAQSLLDRFANSS